MSIRSARFLALALAIGVVAPLLAQQQRQGRGFGGGQMSAGMLLTQKSVQEELKLTEDQITKVTEKNKEIRTKFADDLKDKDKRADAAKKMNEETTKALADIIKPEQMKRLKQIEVQLGGLAALRNEEVAKAIKLSDKQIADVKGLADDLSKDSAELMKDAFTSKDQAKMKEAREKVQSLNKEATAKFLSGLSAEQKTAYKELVGDEFKGQINPFGGRPGGKNKDKE